MKNPRRIILSFFAKLVLAYALFLTLWVGINGWYPRQLQTLGTDIFRSTILSTGSQWVVILKPPTKKIGTYDSMLAVANRKTRAVGEQPFSSLLMSYLPLAMTLSLIIASPVSWMRRILATLLGSLFVCLWVSLALFCMVLSAYCGEPPLGIYTIGPLLTNILGFVTWVVSVSTVPQFVVPIFFWVLATIRREDIQRLTNPTNNHATESR